MAQKAVKSRSAKGGWVTSDRKLTGKTILITGGNTGIGLATALDLAEREAKVIIGCRNSQRGEDAVSYIIEKTGSQQVFYRPLDLASFSSIRNFAHDFKRDQTQLDILINNAGIMMCPQSKTEDGFEMHFGVNYLGHFLLTTLLLDLMKASSPSRIITLSSVMHSPQYNAYIHWDDINLSKSYHPRDAYSQSKLMNLLFSRELAKRLEGTGVTTYCIHPGLVNTDLLVNAGNDIRTCWDAMFCCTIKFGKKFFKRPKGGAQTSIYCAIAPELENVTGKYYCGCKEKLEESNGRDDEAAKKLWQLSEDLITSENMDVSK